MRKKLKHLSKKIHLSRLAASIQDARRSLLRKLGYGTIRFKLFEDLAIPIDIASRRAFSMFTGRDEQMTKEIAVFRNLVKDRKCLLDAGSLYGLFSLLFAEINPSGDAYAIEPSPKCFPVLQRNCKLSKSSKITPINMALGKHDGHINMHYEWIHLIADSEDDKGDKYPVISIDSLLKERGFIPDVMKLDVDGFEGPVLEGAMNLLEHHEPLIFLELHGDWIQRYGYQPIALGESLSDLGYKFYNLDLKPIENIKIEFNVFANRLICTKSGL